MMFQYQLFHFGRMQRNVMMMTMIFKQTIWHPIILWRLSKRIIIIDEAVIMCSYFIVSELI